MRTPVLAAVPLALILAGLPSLAAAKPYVEGWGRFSATTTLLDPKTSQTVVVSEVSEHPKPTIWRAEETTAVRREGHAPRISLRWTDSSLCPALIPTLATLAKLDRFAIQPPGALWPDGQDLPPRGRKAQRVPANEFMNDAGAYMLAARGDWTLDHWDGYAEFHSGGGTPIAHWIEDALRTLEPCWRNGKPPR
jgi:hypothetical protein